MISADGLKADLVITPLAEGEQDLSVEQVETFLQQQGVIHGVQKELLEDALNNWRHHKGALTVGSVALGKAPQSAGQGELEIVVKHATRQADVDILTQAQWGWELGALQGQLKRVDAGAVIGRVKKDSLPREGINVYGASLACSVTGQVAVMFDENTVVFIEEFQALQAKVSGYVWQDGTGRIGIAVVNFNGQFVLECTPDGMSAWLSAHAPAEGGRWPTRQELDEQLGAAGIRFGIIQGALGELFSRIVAHKAITERLLIARGEPAKEGADGQVQFNFNTVTSLQPKQNADGSLDYKKIDLIQSVAQGDVLATLIAPTAGVAGTSVRGEPVAARDGVAAKLPAGANTALDEQGQLVAAVAGNVRLAAGVVEVCEGYTIAGNVDYSTGNVDYKKTVTVGGDVQGGFSLHCGGDLQVNGTIEDAVVKVEGTVLCRAGFVGQGKGSIEARGDVNLGFIKNQLVHCHGTVTIARECLNATIYARKNIFALNAPISVAGGYLTARDMMEIHTVGNESGIKTMLEVGLDFVLEQELVKSNEQLESIAVDLKKFHQPFEKYDRLFKIKKGLPPRDLEVYEKIKHAIGSHQQQIKTIEKRIELLSAKMYDYDSSSIKIIHSAMPGTMVKIGQRHMLVREEIIGPKTIRLQNFEIKVL
jgi:uncharacterized protein (DUF342 family)